MAMLDNFDYFEYFSQSRSDSSFNFMVFFCIFFAQLIATTIQAVGIPNLGTW